MEQFEEKLSDEIISQVLSLSALKGNFQTKGYDLSFINEGISPKSLENITKNYDNKASFNVVFMQICYEWTVEWRQGWGHKCFASLPVLSLPDSWIEGKDGLPRVHTVLAKEGHLYEPGAYSVAIPCNTLPGQLSGIQRADLVISRDEKESRWLVWSRSIVDATLQEMQTLCSKIPQAEHTSFLLYLLRNINLCAQQFCPMTRGINYLEIDTRIGSINEMIFLIGNCLIGIDQKREYDLPNLIVSLLEVARFSDSSYILFDALQWFVAYP